MLVFHQIIRRSLSHQLAAVFPGSRADIHHTVGRADRILVMFHHDQAVSQIAEAHQRPEQFVIISLVKTDAGLVQNIGDPHKAGPYLCRQADPLGLASGKR